MEDKIYGAVVYMEEILDAFELFRETMEYDGFHSGEIDPWEAICFVRRFPLHLAAINVLLRDLHRNVETLKEAVGE